MKRIMIPLLHVVVFLGFYLVVFVINDRIMAAYPDYRKLLRSNLPLWISIVDVIVTALIFLYFALRRWWGRSSMPRLLETSRFVKISRKELAISIWIGIGCGLFFVFLISIPALSGQFPDLNKYVASFMKAPHFFWVILVFGVMAPIFEETLFRGLVLNELRRAMPFGAALLVHALLYAYFQPSNTISFIAFFLAFVLAITYLTTGSVWANITVSMSLNIVIFATKRIGFHEVLPHWGNTALIIATLFWTGWIVIGLLALRGSSKSPLLITKHVV